MKKWIGTLLAVLVLSTATYGEVSKEDLQKLAAAGISDPVILAYVRSCGPAPRLSAQDLIDLKNAGLSNVVLDRIAAEEPGPKTNTPIVAKPEPRVVFERRVQVVTAPPLWVVGPCVWVSPWRPWRPWHPWVRVGLCW
ncbi:MAG TPA: hypothetical protein VKU80_06780 [Planctomycetota bacterium]|nr:hypothetical protein [Planctomycetota bacterium]